MIFDSHAHYDDEAFAQDREELLASLSANGIGRVVNVGSNIKSSEQCVRLASEYDFIYASVGVHPNDALELEGRGLGEIQALVAQKKVVAIGEIGLDYHWPEPEHDVQKKWFRAQLELAKELDMPVIVHSREAAQDTYDIMREMGGDKINAVIHCFSYGPEMAEKFLELGYFIGLGGVLTYKNGRKQKEVMQMLPMDRVLLETDCPYLSPEGHRGERNSSLYLPIVLKEMAQLKGCSVDEIEAATYRNAEGFYRI